MAHLVKAWMIGEEVWSMHFALDIDHISAYALIVETGTKLAAQIKRGELTMPMMI